MKVRVFQEDFSDASFFALFCQNKVEVEYAKINKHENLLNSNLVADSSLQNAQLEVDRILEMANINRMCAWSVNFLCFQMWYL